VPDWDDWLSVRR
jgi:hypothetical protein